MPSFGTIRAVALFEAAKGTLVLVTGFGALSLVHHHAQRFAEQLVGHLHLNPAKHFPRIFIDAAANLTETRLLVLAILAATYGLVRFIEAYGLWYGRRWAEWFAAVRHEPAFDLCAGGEYPGRRIDAQCVVSHST
jgi:uncharacterized membrane protein (DUF2068 family)